MIHIHKILTKADKEKSLYQAAIILVIILENTIL
jgi:hypothetical protein